MKIRNDKGYALLIVLLLVVFIMIVSATFVTGSVSHAKQEKTVETNNMAVVAAEMGVDYYKTTLNNAYNVGVDDLVVFAQEEINKIIKTNKKITQADLSRIRLNIVTKLETILQDEIDKFDFDGEKEINDQVIFRKGLWLWPDVAVGELKLEGPVFGRSSINNEKELNFEITFFVPELTYGQIGAGPGEGYDAVINMWTLYPNPIGLPNCVGSLEGKECMGNSDISLNDMNNSIVYFNGDYKDKNKNNNKLNSQGSKIYIKGSFNAENMNSMNNTSFIVGGNLVGDQFNGQGISNSTILLGGSMNVNKQIEMNKSTIMIGGALHVVGHFTVQNNSKVCVGGALQVEKDFTVDKTSVVYVHDKSWNNLGTEIKNHTRVIVVGADKTEEEFWSICQLGEGNTTSQLINPDWKDPIVGVTY